MDEDLKHNLTAGETWIRGLFILMFAFFLFISRIVTAAVVVIQFLFTVFTGHVNENLKTFGLSLSRYIYQCLLFLTFNSDVKPFPFEEWPESEMLTEKEAEKTIKSAPKKKARAKAKSTVKKTAKSENKANTEGETQTEAEAMPASDDATAPDSSSAETDTKSET